MVDVAVKCPLHAEYHKYIVCEKTTHLVVGPSLYIVKLLATTNVNVEDQYRKRKSPADVLVSERWEGTLNDFKADEATSMGHASPFVVILCVARALKHLARFNLAHTDLSTGNIAVRTVDRRNAAGSFVRLIACAAVLDLQMCKQWGYPFAPQEVALRASCAYNAPDRNVNPRTDVYSLGPALSERTGLMRFPTSAPSRNDLFVVRTREFCNSCMNPNYEDRPSIEDCERFALAGLVQLKAHRAGPSTA
jgi:serine/threonine protein kinase